jgi:peptide/nickel transport system substrate-binding protein
MLARSWRLILAVLLVTGCGDKSEVKVADVEPAASTKDAGKPVTGDWLLYNLGAEPEQLNPFTSSDGSARDVIDDHIFQSLLTRDRKTLELRPYLAEERPTISADHLTYTFKLRRDVRFQDGSPMTGEDVLFSVKTIKCPLVNAPHLRVYFNALVAAELVDPYTIKMSMKEPYFLNESVLGGNIYVIPRHHYDPENLLGKINLRDLLQDPGKLPADVKRFAENFNKNYNRKPLGTGPYKFNYWKTGREIELLRDPKYWGRDKPGIEQVYLDRIKFRIINNDDAALVTLKSGGLDYIERLNPVQGVRGTNSERFKREFRKLEYYTPYFAYIGWNNNHPIFSDKRVRQAMTYFTDRKQIVKTILFGYGEVVDSPIYLFRPEYNKSLFNYPYDPNKAMELLKQAGWQDSDGDGILDKTIDGKKVSFRFEFKVPASSSTGKSVLLVLQEELKRHGIAASVRELDWPIFLGDVRNHKFDVVTMAWGMNASEPDDYQVWHSSQAVKNGSNHISYKNPRVDKILEDYRGEFDAKKRIELYQEYQRILNDEQPYTFLYARKYVSAIHRRFENVEAYAEGLKPDLWWVAAGRQKYISETTLP